MSGEPQKRTMPVLYRDEKTKKILIFDLIVSAFLNVPTAADPTEGGYHGSFDHITRTRSAGTALLTLQSPKRR